MSDAGYIYIYDDELSRAEGFVKIGKTTTSPEERVDQQTKTGSHRKTVEIVASFDREKHDGTPLTDAELYSFIERVRPGSRANNQGAGTEWFRLSREEAKVLVSVALTGRTEEFARVALEQGRKDFYTMRPDQSEAVRRTVSYYRSVENEPLAQMRSFLHNCKMRFGKTFVAYKVAEAMRMKRILVVTHKPATVAAWRDELENHIDFTGWRFINRDTRSFARDEMLQSDNVVVAFASMQDVNGRTSDAQIKAHNSYLYETHWDIVIVDEYHYGSWNERSKQTTGAWKNDEEILAAEPLLTGRQEFEHPDVEEADEEVDDIDALIEALLNDELEEPEIDYEEELEEAPEEVDSDDETTAEEGEQIQKSFTSKFYLYLSGTPFRSISTGEFTAPQIYTWSYIDEQRAKNEWDDSKGDNPYIELPEMVLLTYNLPDEMRNVAMASDSWFSLSAFFKATMVDGEARFVHEDKVLEFLNYLCETSSGEGDVTERPYGSVTGMNLTNHSFWLLNSVNAVMAMGRLLRNHPFYGDKYEILTVAGNAPENSPERALQRVREATETAVTRGLKGTITLSCGKLSAGVSVRKWNAVFMLSSTSSPEEYFQSIFRAGTPNYTQEAGYKEVKKKSFYVYDFNPDRTLHKLYEYSMHGIAATTEDGEVTEYEVDENGEVVAVVRKKSPEEMVDDMISFMPIYSTGGESGMTRLNAREVMDIARSGSTSRLLANQWKSPQLITMKMDRVARILADDNLIDIIDRVLGIEGDEEDLTFEKEITSSPELRKTRAHNSEDDAEKRPRKVTDKRLIEFKKKLRLVVRRIPLFIYLTDEQEHTVGDLVATKERELFEEITGLSVDDFTALYKAELFNTESLAALIDSFAMYERRSLAYLGEEVAERHPKFATR